MSAHTPSMSTQANYGTREEMIADEIANCPGCDSRQFPRRHDCESCIEAVDERLTLQAAHVTIARLRAENLSLRQRIAHIHNHELHDIQNQIDQVFLRWLPKVRAANRKALLPPADEAAP